MSETKYKEFRNWFDQRLDDAIAAAEAQETADPKKFALEGNVISDDFFIRVQSF